MLNFGSFGKSLGAILALFVLASAPVFPQGNTGRILGVVTDQSGGYIANANVTVTDVERGTSRNLVTDESGGYVAISLLPGTYAVRVEAKGFKAFDRKGILLEVGKDVTVDIVLQTGSTNEVITVTEEAPMVDPTSTTLGGTLSNEIINDLPLNGRNYQNLLTLRPGTTVYPGGGPWTQMTNGVRPEDTSYIVDGVTNDEAFMGLSVTNAAAVLGDAGTLLPIDAIQEFNTQVNPKAEFGWKPGAITSVGLKSGTNTIHGSAYAFGRSDSFDARNYFNPVGTPKTPVSLEQYGGSFGGKIIPDKLFYFASYEGQMYTVGNALTGNVPTTASVGDPSVSVPDAEAALAAQGIAVNPLSAYLLTFYTPNSSQSTQVPLDFSNDNTSKNVVGKVDYHLSDKNTIGGSYFFGNDTITGMDSNELLPQFETRVHSRAQTVSAHWAYTPNSTWANEVRFGFTHYTLQITPNDLGFKYQINTGLSNPLLAGIPNVRIDGFTELGAFHNFPKIVGPDRVFDVIDQISYLKGKHTVKFGGEIRRDLVHQATFRGGRGRVRFRKNGAFPGATPLEDFLAGDVKTADFLSGDPTRNISQWLYSGYVQDDYRLTPRITLNLGLRYEFQAVPTEDKNQFGNFDPAVGFEQVGKNIGSIYKPDHKNFAPRIGVAWDVTGKGTTIVRAGAGMVYSLLSMSTYLSQQNTQNTVTLGVGTVPTGATIFDAACPSGCPGVGNMVTTGVTLTPVSSTNPVGINWVDQSTAIYPSSVTSLVQCSTASPCNTFAMQRNFRTPYVENWTLGIQHAFSGKLSLESSYVGNHGVKLPGVIDLNQADPTTGVQPFATQYPYLNYINYLTNIYGSTYHGLQNTVTARNLHGLDFVLGYTYSHAIDDLSSNWVAFLPMDSKRWWLDKGASDGDIRHRFTLSITYSLPEKKTWTQLLEGWQVNTIITEQTGQPWNVNDQANNFSLTNESADRWDFFGNPSDFTSRGSTSFPLCTGPSSGSCTYTSAFSGTPIVLSDAQTSAAWALCSAKAPDPVTLGTAGCYVSFNGKSVLVPNGTGQFGTMGRNIFRDQGFHNIDFSVSKNFHFGERMKAQFRAEMFNVFNHPNFANPNGATSGYGQGAFADPSAVGIFGCSCATPDGAAFNPVLGSGSARAIQLGLKFTF